MTDVKTVTIFRALTGERNPKNEQHYLGFSNQQLAEKGIFNSNEHPDQSKWFGDEIGRRIEDGLPIYLTEEAAVLLLENLTYPVNPPALVKVSLPWEKVFGEKVIYEIFKNRPEPELAHLDQRLTEDDLRADNFWKYECYLRCNIEPGIELRHLEEIYRPNKMEEGKIVREAGFKKVDMEQLKHEGQIELNRT